MSEAGPCDSLQWQTREETAELCRVGMQHQIMSVFIFLWEARNLDLLSEISQYFSVDNK